MKLRMFVWHRVADYARWKAVFDSHRKAHQETGLALEWIRQDDRDPNHVIFMFEVADREKAEAFVNDPAAAQAGEEAGVLAGGYFYVHDA